MKLRRACPVWKDELRESPSCGKFAPRGFHQSILALTLLEMMVAVTLLAVIMIGLLAMFNQTQKALRVANAQTDVFENGRGAMQMICRDLAEMTLFPDTNVFSSYVTTFPSPIPGGSLPLPATNLPVAFADAFWLTRVNDDWQGFGYFVADDPARGNNGVGTLYRFSTNRTARVGVSMEEVFDVVRMYPNALVTHSNVVHRVSDGIVHFMLTAIYVETNLTRTNFVRATNFQFTAVLPAFVDVELGVLEPATLKQFESLKSFDLASAKSFLVNNAGKIHFLRERVPIRNFVNPHRANELP